MPNAKCRIKRRCRRIFIRHLAFGIRICLLILVSAFVILVSLMIKIAMIGAGSVVFSKNLTGDILSFPEFKNATLSYMDIDPQRLEVGVNLCKKVAHALGANPKIEGTSDRRQALRGADFVIN